MSRERERRRERKERGRLSFQLTRTPPDPHFIIVVIIVRFFFPSLEKTSSLLLLVGGDRLGVALLVLLGRGHELLLVRVRGLLPQSAELLADLANAPGRVRRLDRAAVVVAEEDVRPGRLLGRVGVLLGLDLLDLAGLDGGLGHCKVERERGVWMEEEERKGCASNLFFVYLEGDGGSEERKEERRTSLAGSSAAANWALSSPRGLSVVKNTEGPFGRERKEEGKKRRGEVEKQASLSTASMQSCFFFRMLAVFRSVLVWARPLPTPQAHGAHRGAAAGAGKKMLSTTKRGSAEARKSFEK